MKKLLPAERGHRFHALLCSLFLSFGVHLPLQAQSTWNGGGVNNNWTTGANWGGTAPASGNALIFGGTLQPATNNDFAAGTGFGTINFTNDGTTGKTAAFTLSGNRIALGGTITLAAVSTGLAIEDTISLDMSLSATRTITTATGHSLRITGVLSGSGGLSKQGGSGTLLTLTGLNTFTGTLTLTSGTISFNAIANSGTASALGAGGTIVAGAGNGSTGTLLYTGATASTNRQVQIGTSTITGTAGLILQNDGTGALTFSNANFNVAFTTATASKILTLRGSNAGSNMISGAIIDNNTANLARISVTKEGTNTWVLAGANTYTGTTTVRGGLLRLDNANALPGGVATTGGTSALLFDGTSATGGIIGLTASTGDFTRGILGETPGVTQVGWTNGAWGGFAAFGGDRTVNFGGSATPASVTWSSSGGVLGGGLILSDATADSTLTMANPISLNNTNGTRTIQVNDGSAAVDAVMAGVLSFSTSRILKTGTGTLALTAANTYGSALEAGTVSTTISAGTLQLGNGGTTGSLSSGGDIENNATLAFNRSNALTVSNPITGTGTVVQAGSGITSLTGASTYSGATIISSGVLQIGSGGTTGSINSTSGITNNATLAFNRSNTLVFTPAISGAGSVSQNGSGITSLSGNNTYTGGTMINTGALSFLNTNAKPAEGVTTVAAGATIGLGVAAAGTFFTSADITSLFAGTLALVANDETSNVGIDTTAGNFTYAESIAATTRGLAKLGANTLTLTGVNAYTGTTFIGGGVLDVGTISAGALGGGGLVFANGGVLQGNGAFTRGFSGTATAAAGQLTGPSGGFAARGGTLTVNFGGAGNSVTLSNGSVRFGTNFVFGSATADSRVIVVNPLNLNTLSRTFTVNSGLGGDSAELQGAISSGDPTDGIIKEGTGLLILSAANSYTGATTINAGTLQIGSAGTTGSINNTSGITNNGTLTFNKTGTLALIAPITGTGVVNQAGTGVTSISGTNTYTGGTNVTAGAMSLLNTSAKPASGSITVAAGATLGLGVSTNAGFFTSADVDSLFAGTMANVTSSTTSRVGIDTTAGDFTYASSISGTRGLTKLGDHVLSLTGTNTYTGRTTVTDGVLRLDSSGAVPGGIGSTGGTSNIAFNGGVIGLTAASGDFTRGIGSGVSQVVWITNNSGGFAAFGGNRVVNFGGNATPSTITWSNGNGVLGDGLILGDTASDSTLTVANPITLNNSASSRTITVHNGSAAIDAVMAGALTSELTASDGTRVIKSGAGTLALTGVNSYVSGSSPVGTTISAGTLMLGNGGTTGSLLYIPSTTGINSDVTISSGATFAFNRSDTGLTVANLIIGAGSVAQVGTGTTTLSNANTYSGGTTISTGTLLATNTTGSATGTGAVTMAGSTILGGTGIIAPTGSNGVSVAGTISPGVAGTNNGVGTLTFTMANGSLTLGSTGALALQLRSNGTNGLTLSYNPDGTLATISGTGSSTGSDRLVFSASGAGLLDFTSAVAGSIGITFTGGYTPQALDAFDLLDWSTLGVSGLDAGLLSLPTLADPNLFWDISKFASDGVIAIGQAVPEPSRGLLLLGGLCRVCVRRRRG